MRPPSYWMIALAVVLVASLFAHVAHAQGFRVSESRITAPLAPTPAWETTPRLGNTGTSDVVVYATREMLPGGALGKSDIWYQRLDHGQVVGAPLQVTNDGQDNKDPDISGDFIVYIARDSTTSLSGRVMVDQLSTTYLYSVGSALIIQDPHIHGNAVVWREGGAEASQVMLYDLAWLGTARDADVLAGPIPPTSDVEIGDRFVVWLEMWGAQRDVFAYDRTAGINIRVTNTSEIVEGQPSTSGPWIAWQTFDMITGNTSILAQNMDTMELRTVTDVGVNYHPTIDGDLIAWESTRNGNEDIYLYRISTGETFRVTSSLPAQYLNDVFGHTVAYVDQRSGNEDIYVSAFAFVCDVNNDRLVNRTDINLILGALGQPGNSPDDPRDADGDGRITVLDARKCVLACNKPACATGALVWKDGSEDSRPWRWGMLARSATPAHSCGVGYSQLPG